MDNDTNECYKLKPCPFCGGIASIRHKDNEVFWVQCEICQNSIRWGRDPEGVVIRWNNRPLEEKLEDEVERLKSELGRA